MAENGVSRGAATGLAIGSAGIAAIIASMIGQVLDAPADRRLIEGAVKANTAALIGLSNELGSVGIKQDDVRERLTVVESAVLRAGEDRYRGEQAALQVKHYDLRLDELSRRLGILENTHYLEGDGHP